MKPCFVCVQLDAKVELKKVCVYMGGLAAECRILIDTMFDELWDAAMSAFGVSHKRMGF